MNEPRRVLLDYLVQRTAQAEDEFAQFFAQSLDLLCVVAPDGSLQRPNPAWTAQLGWTLEDLRARQLTDLVHPHDREATQSKLAALAECAQPVLFENRCRHHDGSWRWLQWDARLVPGGTRICASARDITSHKRLEREIVEITDRERERMGRDLHDGLCQTLAGIAALSTTLSKQLARCSESESAQAADIARLVNGAIREARGLARDLSPIGPGAGGLSQALATLSGNTERSFRIVCTSRCDPASPGLSAGIAAQLLRIAQQAVSNALAHGRARRIDISLILEGERGLLRVEDDGVGLPDCRRDRGGIGLHTMAYRARAIGGACEVRRRAVRGTVVSCDFPLSQAPGTGDAGQCR